MNVQNELGVIVVFAQACQQNGWKINHIQSEFPDAIIQDKDGETYRAEFEFCSSNFKAHRHDLFQCDVIICWEDDWDDCPLTVWSMKDWNDRTITIRDRKDLMIASLTIENKRLKRKVVKLASTAQQALKMPMRDRATAILEEHPDITGTELAGTLSCSSGFARRLKREIQSNGNGHKQPIEEKAT